MLGQIANKASITIPQKQPVQEVTATQTSEDNNLGKITNTLNPGQSGLAGFMENPSVQSTPSTHSTFKYVKGGSPHYNVIPMASVTTAPPESELKNDSSTV